MDHSVEVALKGTEFKHVVDTLFEPVKQKYGLKKVDIEVLYHLNKYRDFTTPTDIHNRLKINKGHISQAIDTLTSKGFIVATPNPKDKRSMHYSVTDEASEVIEEIMDIKTSFEEKVFAGISKEEIETYKKISCKIMKNIYKILEE